jgi:hypothetical protein
VQKVEATYLYQKEMEISKYESNMQDRNSKDELGDGTCTRKILSPGKCPICRLRLRLKFYLVEN